MALDRQTIDIDKFIEVCAMLPPEISVVVQGRAAIGKSESVSQIAALIRSDFYKDPINCERTAKILGHHPTVAKVLKEHKATNWHYDFGIPVVMRRLTQMNEGDVTGLPKLTDRGTDFNLVSWLYDACEFPIILFLDERNRALQAVKQAVFEIQDSRSYYGRQFHEETRVYVAENIGDEFIVEPLDPAEISRAGVLFELNPSPDAWIRWARMNGIHEGIVSFIEADKDRLEYRGTFQPNKKVPDRRGWVRLARTLDKLGFLTQESFNNMKEMTFFQITGGMLGAEASGPLFDHLKQYFAKKEVKAHEIFEDWPKVKKLLGKELTNEKYNYLQKLSLTYFVENDLTNQPKKLENYKQFMADCPAEIRMALYSKLLASNFNNYIVFNDYIADLVTETVTVQKYDEENKVVPEPYQKKKK